MALDDRQTYYDTLEIMPDASPQEVREAYVRLKSAYSKDGPALYSLLSRDDTDRLLKEIEVAYQILSSPDKRKEYDRHHGLSIEVPEVTEVPPLRATSAPNQKNVSWDIFDAPTTDFQPRSTPSSHTKPHQETIDTSLVQSARGALGNPDPTENLDPELEDLIQKELEWRGEFIRRVRESRKLSIEELAEFTKISKRYLKAIEEDDFKTLPAAVYLRGFMIQISKRLKIPGETVAAAYLARYRQACKTQD